MTKKSPGNTNPRSSSLTRGFSHSRPSHSSPVTRTARAAALVSAGLWLVFLAYAPLMAGKEKPPTTKTVHGQVLDASGNGISGAVVEMTDLTTGVKSAIYTQTGGRYQFSHLKLTHDYQFRATYKGKSSEVRKASSLDSRMRLVLNLHIPPPKN